MAAAGVRGCMTFLGVAIAATALPVWAADVPTWVSREVLVRLRDGASPDAVGRALGGTPSMRRTSPVDAARAGRDARAARAHRRWTVTVPDGADVAQAVAALRAHPDVEDAEPNHLRLTTLVPSDPRYPQQWSHQLAQTEAGWDVELGDPSTVIAIVDTGVDHAHEDLAANVWRDAQGNPGRDTVDVRTGDYTAAGFELDPAEDYRTEDGNPTDRHGHGTHVAGIAAAAGDNGVGVSGVCPRCRIMPMRAGFVLRYRSGSYGALESDDVARAIVWAADHGAHVINMSFASQVPSATEEDAIAYAVSRGVVMVAAGSNDGLDVPHHPAASPGVIGVAATGPTDRRASYSNHGFWLDVAAPGGDAALGAQILSTVPPTAAEGHPSGYAEFQGTSMASPYVAGLVGLLRSRFPTIDARQVRDVLRSTADAPAGDDVLGYGRVNVRRALAMAAPPAAVAEIAVPVENAVVRAPGPALTVVGTATGTNFVLEVGPTPYGPSWTTIGMGTSVGGGSLGVLDPAILSPGARHWLRLTVADTTALRALVPFYLGQRFSLGDVLSSPTVADLDGDGSREIVVATHRLEPSSGYGQLHAFRADGTPVPGFPCNTAGQYWPFNTSPAVGDLDGDGTMEIVHATAVGVRVLNADCSPRAPWPLPDSTSRSSPVLADLDGDGDLEIVVSAGHAPRIEDQRALYAWHHDGTVVEGFPVEVANAGTAAVGDLDRDGSPEIVFLARPSQDLSGSGIVVGPPLAPHSVHVVDHRGRPRAGWPRTAVRQTMLPFELAPPLLVDFDADGSLEVVTRFGVDVHVWNADGALRAGWPAEMRHPECCGAMKQPLPIDLDDDGSLELVSPEAGYQPVTNEWHLVAHRADGSLVPGFDAVVRPGPRGWNWPGAMLAAGDVDGDGKPEIVGMIADRLMAWHRDGTAVEGFPRDTTFSAAAFGDLVGSWWAYPAVDDLDGDGFVDIVAPTNTDHLHVFPMPVAFTPSPYRWSAYQHDASHTGVLPSRCGNGVVDPGEACDDAGESVTCNRNCRSAVCGDGVRNATAGEDCDGTDGAAAGCCTAACAHVATGTPCDDGDVCTQGDACDAGGCVAVMAPATTCRAPAASGASTLRVQDGAPDAKDMLTWNARTTGALADFGDPASDTPLVLCLYAGGAGAVTRKVLDPGGTCGSKPCWKTKPTGFAYAGRAGEKGPGLTAAKLTARSGGALVLAVKGKGVRLAPPAVPLPSPVTLQLHNARDGSCWGARFHAGITTNADGRFHARSD